MCAAVALRRLGRVSNSVVAGVRSASSCVEEHYDIITIGSGGGSKVSTPAANLGLKVAMVEHGFDAFGEHLVGLGGTCLTRGCIPSKMLIHPADVVAEIQEAERFGIKARYDGIDFTKLVERVCNAVDGDSKSIQVGYGAKNAIPERKHLYTGTAKFVGPKTIQVSNSKTNPTEPTKTISADYVFLAAGAAPAVPPIPGLKDTPFLTSTEALRLKEMPRKMIVIGAGYIATELGHMYGALGTEVHMMARSELLRAMDVDARKEFSRVFSEKYNVHTGIKFHHVAYDRESKQFTLTYDQNGKNGLVMQADTLLVSTGVDTPAALMDTQKASIELREGGFVKVDSCLRTTAPGVWSFGDAAGNYLFRHCANFEGEYLLENVVYPIALGKGLLTPEQKALLPAAVIEKFSKGELAKDPDAFAGALEYPPLDYDQGMPWAVFSNPQVAGIGASEDELIAKGLRDGVDYVKGINPYASSAMGDARMSDHGFVKILVDTKTRRVLGCVIVGYEASTMVHQVIPIMRTRGLLDDCLYMIHIHPALNEIFRNACRKARDALVAGGFDVPLKLRLK